MPLLRRIAVILAGFIAGNFLAVNVLLAGKVLVDFDNLHHYSGGSPVGYLLLVVAGTVGDCVMALIPTLLVVAFTETLRICGVWFYVLAGGLGALLFDVACTRYDIIEMRSFCASLSFSELAIVTFAGIVAGYVFWRVAGSRSGEWRAREPRNTLASV
jgi:hypothetical protein